jgi:hypothetical protein
MEQMEDRSYFLYHCGLKQLEGEMTTIALACMGQRFDKTLEERLLYSLNAHNAFLKKFPYSKYQHLINSSKIQIEKSEQDYEEFIRNHQNQTDIYRVQYKSLYESQWKREKPLRQKLQDAYASIQTVVPEFHDIKIDLI